VNKDILSPIILLFAEGPDIIYLIRRYSERAGCQVVSTASATELTELLNKFSVVLILIDMHLVNNLGEIPLQKLLSDPMSRHIPIFLCASSEVEIQPWKDVVNGYLMKPVTYTEFIGILVDIGITHT
jgi:two-component system, chemotaxis family, response regulator PixH